MLELMSSHSLRKVLARLDELNAGDPNTETVDGTPRAGELVFADRLESWVRRLEPNPSEELVIAARGQHVRRWTVPRARYPEGRAGYLRWREDLKRLHADIVAEEMRSEGFGEASISRARAIVLKRDLASNRDVQTMEDALCLVFLESQFEQLRVKTPDDKMVDILRKTWRKMSEKGRAAALALPVPAQHRALIERALA